MNKILDKVDIFNGLQINITMKEAVPGRNASTHRAPDLLALAVTPGKQCESRPKNNQR